MRFIVFCLLILPVLDLALMGHLMGFWPTILLVMGTAFLGVICIRHQGMAALARGRAKFAAGQLPAAEMTAGLFLALAGLLLIHPGVTTDMLGLLCLMPGVRHLLAAGLALRFGRKMANHRERYTPSDIIDGEYESVVDVDAKHIEHKKP